MLLNGFNYHPRESRILTKEEHCVHILVMNCLKGLKSPFVCALLHEWKEMTCWLVGECEGCALNGRWCLFVYPVSLGG